jgi:hypothetical protein
LAFSEEDRANGVDFVESPCQGNDGGAYFQYFPFSVLESKKERGPPRGPLSKILISGSDQLDEVIAR